MRHSPLILSAQFVFGIYSGSAKDYVLYYHATDLRSEILDLDFFDELVNNFDFEQILVGCFIIF